ncbi:SRPBCC family protein [Streptacidiphilus monticola]|uniref:SRPBCC family protein n=1 Tax=Streptacidiphilus monticola TaxID=2161674 RepID=A0ABW1G8G7_9ACTN
MTPPTSAPHIAGDARLAAQWRRAAHRAERRRPRREATRTLTASVAAPPAQVFAVYADIGNHLGAHAFLRRLVLHRDTVEAGLRTVEFTAIEDVPVLGVRVPTRTHARQRIETDGLRYRTETWTSPAVTTRQLITFAPGPDGGTLVTEELVFSAPPALLGFVAARGAAAHEATHRNLRPVLEGPAATDRPDPRPDPPRDPRPASGPASSGGPAGTG